VSIVVGTAGHIDHGKTALLRALTGIDADRLPEERRRGMTIDLGYAWLRLPDGREVDFVDVPGHDRLVGNMLVGAGEIDAALLVVAADDGPRPQTLDHLELLDALGIVDGLAVVTKIDLLAADDPRRSGLVSEVRDLLGRTRLAASPVMVASSSSGEGIEAVREALAALADRVAAREASLVPPARLAVDRVFTVRGRGVVVTGTLRGGAMHPGQQLRVLPGGRAVRVRELQVHSSTMELAGPGRLALNLAGVGRDEVRRGDVLVAGPGLVAADRLLVALRHSALGQRLAGTGEEVRLHLGTEQVDARLRGGPRLRVALRSGERTALLHLARPIAVSVGDRFVLRHSASGAAAGGGRVLDVAPPTGSSRRRLTPDRLAALADAANASAVAAALVELHGAIPASMFDGPNATYPATPGPSGPVGRESPGLVDVDGPNLVGRVRLAPDVLEAVETEVLERLAAHTATEASSAGLALSALRPEVARGLRRRVSLSGREAAEVAAAIIDRLIEQGRLARTGDVLHAPRRAPGIPGELAAAMDRLEAALAVPAPPPLGEAIRATGCPAEALRLLRAAGRIVELEPDLAYADSTYRELERLALDLAAAGPLSPAAFRDATGTSRRYALAILEDLDRRILLRRTDAGHVLGPRSPAR